MSDNKKVKLIAIYMYISELFEKELQYSLHRHPGNALSNNVFRQGCKRDYCNVKRSKSII